MTTAEKIELIKVLSTLLVYPKATDELKILVNNKITKLTNELVE